GGPWKQGREDLSPRLGHPHSNLDMRILMTGDRFRACHKLAAEIIRRLVERCGPEVVIVHGSSTGVDGSFATEAKGSGVAVEADPVNDGEWPSLAKCAGPIRNGRMVRTEEGLCLAVHRFVFNSEGTKDCARLALAAGIPTHLIDSEQAAPMRLRDDDPRLE